MKKYAISIIFILSIFPFASLYSVGGISNSKLIVPSADPIGYNDFEFEPAFSMFRARGKFNDYGHLKNIPKDYDQLDTGENRRSESESVLNFRLTGGFFPNFEGGFTFGHVTSETNTGDSASTAYEDLQMGGKYLLNPDDSIRFALEGGINMKSDDWTTSYEGGTILTWDITDKLSLDADILYSASSRRTVDEQKVIERGMGYNIGLGYTLFGVFQPIVELGYSETYTWRYRNYRPTRNLATNLNIDSETDIDVNSALGLSSTQEIFVPGFGTIGRTTPPIQEKVKVWERKMTLSAGFTYTVNPSALVILIYSHDFKGVNTLAGRTIAGAFTFTFSTDADANADTNADTNTD